MKYLYTRKYNCHFLISCVLYFILYINICTVSRSSITWRSPPTTNGWSAETHIHDTSLKRLRKCSVSCTVPVSTWHFLLYSTFKRSRSSQKRSATVLSEHELHSVHFSVLIESKRVYAALWMIKYFFHFTSPLSSEETLQASRRSIVIYMEIVRTSTFLSFINSNPHS